MSDDLALLAAWRGGDRSAGNRLFERHFDGVCRFFANKVDRDVDDLVQKTFTACVEGRDRFRAEATFRTYLFAVAHNVLRSYLRTRQRHRQRFDDQLDSVFDLGQNPGVLVSKHREQTLMIQALRRIPLGHQTILELYYWENMTAPDLAQILEIPEGTVRGRIRRAKQLLEAELRTLSTDDRLVQSTLSGLESWARQLRDRLVLPER